MEYKNCGNCRYFDLSAFDFPCCACGSFEGWQDKNLLKNPPEWARDWLKSFDTDSATECFTAVNLLKQKMEEQK